MEFFTACCPRSGKVFLDGCYQGENKVGGALHVFQCGAGLHDVSLECIKGAKCRKMTQRVMICGTNPFLPLRLHFLCGL